MPASPGPEDFLPVSQQKRKPIRDIYFRGYRNAAQSIATGGVVTLIPIDAIHFTDPFSGATNNPTPPGGRYRCPVGGVYQVSARVSTSTNPASRTIFAIYKNAVEEIRGTDSPAVSASNFGTWEVTGILVAVIGDLIDMRMFTQGAAFNIEVGGFTVAPFMIHRVATAGG